MLIKCPNCSGKSRISSTNEIAITFRDLYCQCLNAESCGCTFKMTLSFNGYIKPPATTTLQLAAGLIRNLPQAQQRELLQGDLFKLS